MANNVWKLADVLQAQAVADLIDVVSVEEIKENVDKVLPTALVQVVNKATDKTFVRILNVASLDTQAILWGDQKIQERARNLGFKEPVVKSDKQLSDFVDVPDDHKRKPKKSKDVEKALDEGLAKTQGNIDPKAKKANKKVVDAGTQLTLFILRKIELTDKQLADLIKTMPDNGKSVKENVEAMKQMREPK